MRPLISHRWDIDSADIVQDWLSSLVIEESPGAFKPTAVCVICTVPKCSSWPDVVYVAAELYEWGSFALISEHSCSVPAICVYRDDAISFREVPAILECIDHLSGIDASTMYIVHSSGRNHTRYFGTACHFGVITKSVTLGITRAPVCGSREGKVVRQSPPRSPWTEEAILAAEKVGFDVSHMVSKYASDGGVETGRYICGYYVSVGNYISLDKAESVVRYIHKRAPTVLSSVEDKCRIGGGPNGGI